jgi:drug/metabolite transporter (DMT)-like permease
LGVVSAGIVVLVLSTAVLHAGWNAVLRHGSDRLWTSMLIAFGGAGFAALWLPWLPLPNRASLPFMLTSFLLHTAYRALLIFTYRWGELGAVYPIARGSAPLLVTAGAAMFAGEHPSWPVLGAIALVSLGIVALSRSNRATRTPPRAMAVAIATGAVIAGYSVIDGLGARLAGSSFSYVLWLETVESLPWPFLLFAQRGTLKGERAARGDGWRALWAGAASILAYALVVWAMTQAPLGIVSALRETSVVFAAVIGWLFLGERATWHRFATCGLIAAGIAVLALVR